MSPDNPLFVQKFDHANYEEISTSLALCVWNTPINDHTKDQ